MRPIGNGNFLTLGYNYRWKRFTFEDFNFPPNIKRKDQPFIKPRYIRDIESGEALKIDSYWCDRIQMAQKTDGVALLLITQKYEEEDKKKPRRKKKKEALTEE